MGKSTSHALPPLDEKDMHILFELEQDCNRSLDEIAKRTGLSKQTLHYRIQRLVDEGVITGFITAIDAAKLGLANYEVLMQLSPMNDLEKKKFLDFLIVHENVGQVASCSGKFDLTMGILAENVVQFNSIFKGMLGRFPDYVKNYHVSLPYELMSYPRTILIKTEKERKPTLVNNEPRQIGLDEEDVKILHGLSKNARIPVVDLAKAAGISPNTVRQKVKRLENEKVIQKYTILLQPSKMGFQNYELLVNTQNMAEEDEGKIESFCKTNTHVTLLQKAVGKWDLEIVFDAKDSEHFQSFLTEFRACFSNIIKEFEYVPILYVYKVNYLPMTRI